MRALAAQLNTLLFKRKPWNVQSRNLSSSNGKDEASLEQEAERKIGWLLKMIFAGTATFVGYQFFPYMGDNLMHQSISLLHVKDPLFKRMGASRLARFAIDGIAWKAFVYHVWKERNRRLHGHPSESVLQVLDLIKEVVGIKLAGIKNVADDSVNRRLYQRRMKIVEIGGAQELLNMLGSAKDERTQKEALKALSALSKSDEAVKALHNAGAISVIKSTPDTFEDTEIGTYKSNLLKRFQDLRYDFSS